MADVNDKIERLNKSIRDTIATIRQLQESFRSSERDYGGQLNDVNQLIEAHQRLNRVLTERARLRSLPKPAVSGGDPNQAGYGEPPVEPKKVRVNPFSLLTDQEMAKFKVQAQVTNEKYVKALQREVKAAEKTAAEEERIASLRARVANDPVFREYLNQLQSRGLGIEDIQSATSRGGGITQVTAARNMGGINNKYQAYVNEATGASTPGLSSQFRSFGKDILRDIGQFTKWSIAIAAVYTPLQKLGELVTLMIDNESRLADATIAANVPFSKSGEIFDTVASSAEKAGEGINTTIDAYTQSIRAAGRYSDEATKQAAAVKLLDDALILSKLSSLDQSQAIDTLSAALLQSDRSLTQGTELLNKWVRISQIANVDLAALSTGVAVLGDSAETAGLDIDHLNGLIAVLSEQSISGAKEAANTAKALVGSYQSDKAEATLNKYGIALRRTNGEVRGFLEIYQELARLRQEGVLSESSVSEIALALGGGGVRRAKDASALINNVDRLNDLAKESAKATGQDTLAQDALAKKLETVQTANTRLANSFQELAQTLGQDGGLLDLFKFTVDLLTAITKGSEQLFQVLGRSGPILTAFTAGLIALNTMSGGRRDTALAGLGAMPTQFMGFMGGSAQYGGPLQNVAGMGYTKSLMADILRMNLRGGAVIGGLGVAAQGFSNLQAGKNENAAANVGGGIVGGIVGTLISPGIGTAIGANIGSAIGDAFVNAVNKHSEQLADYFVPKITAGGKTEGGNVTYRGKTTQELLDTAYNSLGFFGKIQAYLNSREARPNAQGVYEQYGNKESAAMDIVRKQNPALYQELYRQYQEQQARLAAQTSVAKAGDTTGTQSFRKQLEEQASAARQYQLTQLAQGKITSAEFGRVSGQISGFPAVSIKSVTAFGDELLKVNRDIQNTAEAYDAFLYIAQYGTQDQINLISQYSDDILILNTYIKKLKEEPALVGAKFQLSWGEVTIESPEQLNKLLQDSMKQGSTAVGTTLQQVQASQAQAVKLPPLVGDYNKPLSGKDQDNIIKRGLEIQNKYLVETGKTTEEIAKFKAGIEAFYTTVDRGSGSQFEAVNGLTQQFYDLGKAAADAAGELEKVNPIGFQKFDVPMSTLQDLAQKSLGIGKSWKQKYNYDFKPEDQIAIDQKGIVSPLHADFKILALLLEKIVDQNQKQLDGQYNIPEGATFWVPLTAAYYRRGPGGEGGGLSEMLKNMDFQENTTATSQNTNALNDLTNTLRQSPYDRQAAKFDETTKGVTKVNPAYDRKVARMEDAEGRAQGYGKTALPTGFVSSNLDKDTKSQIPGYKGGPLYVPPGRGSAVPRPELNNVTAPTRLDLRISSNVNLVVDGRVLANAMQSYLASELLRTEQSQGTVTKRYVI